MRKTSKETAFIKEQKILLGQALKAIRTDDERGYISLRKLEEAVKIPASNLKYIEDGVNAPSPEAYDAIIRHIAPTEEERREMDMEDKIGTILGYIGLGILAIFIICALTLK